MIELRKSISNYERTLREKIILTSLSSREFLDSLDEAAKEIVTQATFEATEATIAGCFERILYAVLKIIGISFHPDKEQHIEGLRHSKRGRIDARVGAVVIEYKKPSKLKTQQLEKKAIDQLAEYLISITKDTHTKAYGFLTDGRKWKELWSDDGTVTPPSPTIKLDGSALLRLTQCIHSLELAALTSQNLIRDFCGEDNKGVIFETARTFFLELKNNATPKTKMLWSEWEEIFRLGHNDKSQQKRIEERRVALAEVFKTRLETSEEEYRALFSLHTAYALVIKLMAYRVVAELGLKKKMYSWNDLGEASNPVLRSYCADIEDGEVFRKLGILNLLEGDFFSWYTDKAQWTSEMGDCIRSMVTTLGRYEETVNLFSSIGAVDLFRDLYEATVPQAVRSSFGEFYTPHWLASAVIEASKPKGPWRLLDPCSGSGTFIVVAIERLRNEEKDQNPSELLKQILNRIVAFDLNPLAVLTTRVNYFIHISDLLCGKLEELVIPVYLGDASYTPVIELISKIPCVTYQLKTLRDPIGVSLPLSLVRKTASFVRLMLSFEQAIRSQNEKKAISLIISAMEENERKPEILEKIQDFTSRLIGLEEKGWNGIWARILTNLLTTVAIPRFDVIVGNPPWIDWKNLPAGYREKIKGICIDRGLFSGDGRTGGINLNICALISHVALNNWLKDDGRLSFLMPKELAVQQSYQGWRRLIGNVQRGFLLFQDWTESGHPFDPVKEDFMTYLIGPKKRPRSIVPVIRYIKTPGVRSNPRSWKDWNVAASNLMKEVTLAGQIVPNSTAFTFAKSLKELHKYSLIAGECSYIGREGVEFYPQELQLFRYDSQGPIPGTVFLKNVQVTKSKYRIPARTLPLETKLLFPLVKGSSITPFAYEYDGIIVPFPYSQDDPKRPIAAAILENQSPLLFQFYKASEETIRAQTGFSDIIRGQDAGEFYGLARTGPYSFANSYVCFRDNTNWCAAVVTTQKMPWGETKRFVFQNHAVSMCERNTGSFISEDECHYICSIFNAPIVKKFIHASSDERSFKIRPPVFVPLFDKKDPRHRRLSDISIEIHKDPASFPIWAKEIENLYIDICKDKKAFSKS